MRTTQFHGGDVGHGGRFAGSTVEFGFRLNRAKCEALSLFPWRPMYFESEDRGCEVFGAPRVWDR